MRSHIVVYNMEAYFFKNVNEIKRTDDNDIKQNVFELNECIGQLS